MDPLASTLAKKIFLNKKLEKFRDHELSPDAASSDARDELL
jgi:hypothetical protein